MTDDVNSFGLSLGSDGTEMRLRALRRRFRHAAREPFSTPQLVLLGAIVFLAVFGLGLFGF